MRLVIAHPIAASELGCDLDAVVEVDDERAAVLIGDGFARPADAKKSRPPKRATGADTEGA